MPSRVILLLSLALLTGPVEAESPPPPVLSRSQGELRLAGGGRVLVLQAVPWGSTLTLNRSAEAILVCAGDRAVRLAGPGDWPVVPRTCDNGEPVSAGSYSRLQPRAGRVRSFHGHLLAEAPSRSDDQTTKVPVIVSPASPHHRVMTVADGRPELTWSAVSEAMTYDLVLHRDAKEQRVSFGVLDVECSADPRSRPAAACTTGWPWTALREGEEVRLEVLARTPDPDWPVRRADPVRLRRADASTRSTLAGDLATLEGSGPAASPDLQRAAIYQQAGLYNEAAAALAAHLEENPSATVATRLGDLYLGLGLVRAALNHYQHAGNLLPITGADTVRAEIELGKGRVYARREDPQLAALHLEKALDGFRRLRWDGAVVEVEAELERVRRSLR